MKLSLIAGVYSPVMIVMPPGGFPVYVVKLLGPGGEKLPRPAESVHVTSTNPIYVSTKPVILYAEA